MKPDDNRRKPRRPHKTNDRGLLYRMVRARLGITQLAMAGILEVPRATMVQRECFKRVYTTEEIGRLRELSGLTWQELGDIIDATRDK